MNKGEILYHKGMDMSGSESDTDIWDDTFLNHTYDKALNIVKEEVAKRVAMGTNTHPVEEGVEKSKKNRDNMGVPKNGWGSKGAGKKKPMEWKAGTPCRAIYSGDGLEYEACILKILNEKKCVVTFLGYSESQVVSISSLKPSLGQEECKRQIEEALYDSEDLANPSGAEELLSPEEETPVKGKQKRHKTPKHNYNHHCDHTDLPLPSFNMGFMRNLGEADLPITPPPLMNFASSGPDSEDQALSSMLISWYMSGYYAGLYHGMRRSRMRENRRGMHHTD